MASGEASRDIPTRRAPPPFRRVRVGSIEALGPRMLRVELDGDELAGFAIESPASSVRLLLPPPGRDTIEMPTWSGNQFELADGSRAPIRTFTPRYFDADRLRLTVDMVLHGHGAAADWVRGAQRGDEVAISGPGRSEELDPSARSHLLAGDESAIPAIGQLLEAIPHDHAIDVHVEVAEPTGRLELPTHPGARVAWHDAVDGASPGDALVAAVRLVDPLPDAVWVAGEAAAVQRMRTLLFDERGRTRSNVTARGYWKLGRSAT
jgi:NADPH-dependent ferric siderophore reductase